MARASSSQLIAFMWLPIHVGLAGDLFADAAAKAALNLSEA
jgi:hypothetical protein